MKKFVGLIALFIMICILFASCSNPVSEIEVGDTVFLGSYEQDNDVLNGSEAIEWRVLDIQDGKALVITEYILDARPYNEDYNYAGTWEECSLRTWLNVKFFNTAFDDDEKAGISITCVPAEIDNEYADVSDPGKDTSDRLFVLSKDEAQRYFISDDDRVCFTTEYAHDFDSLDLTRKYVSYGDQGYWWLRSPGNVHLVSACSSEGVVYSAEMYGYDSTDEYAPFFSVRPAMWIDLSSVKLIDNLNYIYNPTSDYSKFRTEVCELAGDGVIAEKDGIDDRLHVLFNEGYSENEAYETLYKEGFFIYDNDNSIFY